MSVDADEFDQLEEWQQAIVILSLARRALKLTQQEVATSMGTVQSAVSELETLQTTPQIDTFVRYLTALNFTMLIREQGPVGIEPTPELESFIEDIVRRVTTSGSLLPLPEWARRAVTEGLRDSENSEYCFTCGRSTDESFY